MCCPISGTADDVKHVRTVLAKYGNTSIKIISKIERPVAVENIDAIIEVCHQQWVGEWLPMGKRGEGIGK
jgi:hypothetical protein